MRVLFRILGLKVEGLENVPQEGALLVAGNHVSNWDGLVLAAALNRPVYFMAKAELFRNPLLAKLLYGLYVFPVERGKGDLQAIRTATQYLNEGKALGIFPEGTRNRSRDLSKVGGGLGFLACRSEAMILPVAIAGSAHWIPCGWFRPFQVRIGTPIPFVLEEGQKKNSENFIHFSQNIMQKIYSML